MQEAAALADPHPMQEAAALADPHPMQEAAALADPHLRRALPEPRQTRAHPFPHPDRKDGGRHPQQRCGTACGASAAGPRHRNGTGSGTARTGDTACYRHKCRHVLPSRRPRSHTRSTAAGSACPARRASGTRHSAPHRLSWRASSRER